MPRYKLNIEYDGSGFVGWQRQANGMSVQQTLEDAVRAFSGETVTLFGAGRTDSGVHALGQVAHFDLSRNFTSDKVRDALNFHVRPQAVVVTAAAAVGVIGALQDKSFVNQLTQNPRQALLGDFENFQQFRHGHTGMGTDEIYHPVMGAPKTKIRSALRIKKLPMI